MSIADFQIPRKLVFLMEPHRYKVAYGGRGAAKSWTYAGALLVKAQEKKIRILCAREIQDSIKESVHKLLSDQIDRLGFGPNFIITDRSILCKGTGSEFIFEGLFRNVNRIKSLEGVDIVWVEEAEKVSDDSWNILLPTIRKDGSEIWISFNPQFADDATYKRFVAEPPPEAVSVLVNYMDNPWFNEVLRKEMEQDKARDHSKYENVWLGKPVGSGRRVWHSFIKDVHVREFSMQQIADGGNCFMAIDPHSHYYPFCLWLGLIPKNDRKKYPEDFYKHIYAEWPTFEDLGAFYHDKRHAIFYKGSLAELATEIKAKDGSQFGIKPRGRFMDPRYAKGAGSWNYSTDTKGTIELFSKRENGGLLFTAPNEKILSQQRQAVHSDMLWDSGLARSEFNEPTISISPTCKNLIASLINHRLEDDSEKESEKYKDPSDTLRILYAGVEQMGYEDPNYGSQPVEFPDQVAAWS